jgi:lipid-A-disaccharide synthase-like uncharacterized protein
MMEIIAALGSMCFAICGIPAAVDARRRKECNYPWSFLLLWLVGEILTLIYIVHIREYLLIINYGINLLCLLVLMRYNRVRK